MSSSPSQIVSNNGPTPHTSCRCSHSTPINPRAIHIIIPHPHPVPQQTFGHGHGGFVIPNPRIPRCDSPCCMTAGATTPVYGHNTHSPLSPVRAHLPISTPSTPTSFRRALRKSKLFNTTDDGGAYKHACVASTADGRSDGCLSRPSVFAGTEHPEESSSADGDHDHPSDSDDGLSTPHGAPRESDDGADATPMSP
ncbi:hypothetical protein C2E23DRAFT_882024 [Lenzites betulinus]|nr:hypothetical protein C2E23DRAFT_882024 [Lenzites betulinus]